MTKARKKTTKNKIYHDLRRAIITDQYRPADRLEVDAIAAGFGTSVSPVRDALQMVGHEGLVTIRPRSGYFVTHMTLKQLRDLLEFREILETAAIDRAVKNITDDQLHQLDTAHGEYTGDDADSYDRYTEENRCFHVGLAEASGNAELADQLGRLMDRLARFMVLSKSGKTMSASHERIVKAIRRQDVAAARKNLLKEIQTSRKTILDRVMAEEADRWTVK